MRKLKSLILCLTLVSFVFVGCTKNQSTQQPQTESVTLTISAAASLTDCLEEVKALYISENPNIDITFNFAGSGSLQQQIEQGAPVDIFFSAGKKQMNALTDKDLMLSESVKDILENKVVLITPVNAKKINTVDELTSDDISKIAIGDPGSVPVGQYSDEILKNLNIFNTIEHKLVFAKDVKEVLSWVETGNVDTGFVYQTDAEISDKVVVSATAPEGSHKPVIYPVGIVKSSNYAEEAQKFIDFLFEEEANQLFMKYGFSPLS